jgi:hypothetical protein
MQTPILSLLLLSAAAALGGIGCEKNVQEVRRRDIGIVAPGADARTASQGAPTAPRGEPKGIASRPRSPTD